MLCRLGLVVRRTPRIITEIISLITLPSNFLSTLVVLLPWSLTHSGTGGRLATNK
jgi:hypothetical protein